MSFESLESFEPFEALETNVDKNGGRHLRKFCKNVINNLVLQQ